MLRELRFAHESWPLGQPFRIARGVRVAIDVITVEIHDAGLVGRGEGSVTPRYGESVASVLDQARGIEAAIAHGIGRDALLQQMAPGAARNAVDSALWDLAVQRTGRSVADELGDGAAPAIRSALTVGIDTPDAMHQAALRLRGTPLVKVKVDGSDPAALLRAVRAAVPDAEIIVDANESWTFELLDRMQQVLLDARIALLEQPLPAGADDALRGFRPAVPLCADESCHTAHDLPQLLDRYQGVNIKLDKTGGLTAAIELLRQARDENLIIMCGCMIATSLGIAPAFHIARHAAFADLDGPWWLKQDRAGGIRVDQGTIHPPSTTLWGSQRRD